MIYVNESWRQFADENGLKLADYGVGTNYLEIAEQVCGEPTEGANETAASLRDILSGRRNSFEVEYPCHSPHQKRWSIVRGATIPRDTAFRVILTHENITERKLAEEDARQNAEELTAIFDSAPFILAVVDADSRIRRTNIKDTQSLREPFSDGSELLPGELLRCVHALRTPNGCGRSSHCEACPIRNTVLDTITRRECHRDVKAPVTINCPEGLKQFTFLLQAVPIKISGEPLALLALQDITEKQRNKDKLQETNQSLEETLAELRKTQHALVEQERYRSIATMAAGIAHDFNNSLTPIQGYAGLLKRYLEPRQGEEKALGYLRHIERSTERAAEIVRKMRKFYKPRTEEDEWAVIELDSVVEEAIAATEPRWRQEAGAYDQDIDVQTQLKSGCRILGNESELHEVLTNLIFNAIDALPDGGTITISTAMQGDKAIIHVVDTGIGMSEETKQQCFDPFYTTKGPRGSGLGLAIYGIIQRHLGTLKVESKEGEGTRFSIELPLSRKDGSTLEEHELPSISPLKILVIEDETIQQELLHEILTQDGHNVETAPNTSEGLRKCHEGAYDLVITDKALPDMSGQKLCMEVKRISPGTPIIMLTGFGDIMPQTDKTMGGADLLISKPVTPQKLRTLISQLLST